MFCYKCGIEVKDTDIFCHSCGSLLNFTNNTNIKKPDIVFKKWWFWLLVSLSVLLIFISSIGLYDILSSDINDPYFKEEYQEDYYDDFFEYDFD